MLVSVMIMHLLIAFGERELYFGKVATFDGDTLKNAFKAGGALKPLGTT